MSNKRRIRQLEQFASTRHAARLVWEVWRDCRADDGETVIGPYGEKMTASEYLEYAARPDTRIIRVIYETRDIHGNQN